MCVRAFGSDLRHQCGGRNARAHNRGAGPQGTGEEDTACIDRLLQLGADTSLTNPDGLTALGAYLKSVRHYDDFNVTFGRPRQGANPALEACKAAPRWRTHCSRFVVCVM